jgi:hypothetical protein
MGQFIDLHGQRFGRWTVLSLGERIIPRGHRYWLCRCDCGTEREVKGGSLRNGSSVSCRKCSHLGELYHSPEYKAWSGMKQRCDNPNAPDYGRCGGRGITYAPEWRELSNFYRDMGRRPSSKHSLGRLDVNDQYSKANCVWATQKQQLNNRRNCVRITRDGETLTLTQWCERLN